MAKQIKFTQPESIVKRDGSIEAFMTEKITNAVYNAMSAAGQGKKDDAVSTTKKVVLRFVQKKTGKNPTVEEIQDLVEMELMTGGFLEVAKAYILYRNKRAELRKRNIFQKRINIKPAEYPELLEYVNAIRHSYWIHTEFNFTSDIQDFKVNINDTERNAIKNTMLAIAQIEVNVKTFWGDVYKKLPKPEIGSVGYTFAESEVRHQDAYAHLLEILGLNQEFQKIKDIPVILERIEYLDKSIRNARSDDNKEYAESILLFSLFIEHVSLFSQFLIIMSFNKYKNLFKGISNAVEATSKEEQIHGLFGIDLINIIKKENPEWFDDRRKEYVTEACKDAFKAENKIVDWIFEKGELNFLPKNVILEFIKNRFNNSLASIGLARIFEIDEALLSETEWFDDEVIATKHLDFFVKRSVNYNKRGQSITSADLF